MDTSPYKESDLLTEYRSCRCLDRPFGLQEIEAPRISEQSAYEGGTVVNSRYWPPLPQRRYPLYSFLLQADPISKRTRDLRGCSTVPQPTAPPRTPLTRHQNFIGLKRDRDGIGPRF
jgi:hypothetical protein